MIRQIVSAALAAALLAPAAAQAQDQPLARVELDADRAGEAKLALTAAAPGADWELAGKESAFLSVQVDGRPVTDVVTFNGPGPFRYEVALGRVSAGKHDITVTLDAEKSPVDAAVISKLEPSLAPADDVVARYAPILYGRNLPEVPGAFENVNTDVPILAYHTSAADAQGNRVIEYTVIWSNEDGGTNTPSLMARWGRTTDIEWFYRVTVDAQGNRVSDAFQALNHGTEAFNGVREDDHPLIQVASSNNNMVAVTDVASSSGYRFFLETGERLPDDRAREVMMDRHPWSYGLMAKEMVREGKVEAVPDPDTQTMSDQRHYLFAEVKKATSYATPPRAGSWAGVALAAKVGDRWYTSNKGVAALSIERDLAAATTIELPAGTTAANIAALKAFAVPNGTPGAYSIDVTSINRAFKLGADFMPGVSFINWSGKETLTPQRTEVVLWENENVVEAPVGGSVPATLSLTLGAPASLGTFTPGVERTYTASTTADITSTAGDATLAVSEPGHLANGAFSLPEPLQVTLSKTAWTAPVTSDRVTVGLRQHIGADAALRTGSYSKSLTFTLSTTTP